MLQITRMNVKPMCVNQVCGFILLWVHLTPHTDLTVGLVQEVSHPGNDWRSHNFCSKILGIGVEMHKLPEVKVKSLYLKWLHEYSHICEQVNL